MYCDSFTLVNKTAGTIGVNVYLIGGDLSQTCLMPLNQQLSASEMYQGDNQIVVLATEAIKVQVSGSTDYNFVMNNINP